MIEARVTARPTRLLMRIASLAIACALAPVVVHAACATAPLDLR
jgi:hypothetical protein